MAKRQCEGRGVERSVVGNCFRLKEGSQFCNAMAAVPAAAVPTSGRGRVGVAQWAKWPI